MNNPHKRTQLTAFEQAALRILETNLASRPSDYSGTVADMDDFANQAARTASRPFYWVGIYEEIQG